MLLKYLFSLTTIVFRLYENRLCRELFQTAENSDYQAPASRNSERVKLQPCRQ